jgi:Dolichyl-phosphate-mannose-protein mannosyltransferase
MSRENCAGKWRSGAPRGSRGRLSPHLWSTFGEVGGGASQYNGFLLRANRRLVGERTFVIETTTEPGRATSELEPSKKGWTKYWCAGALLVVIVFFAFVRMRLRDMPLERDEGEFAYVGQLMLQGIPPYKIASNMKLPGTYAAYAAMMAVFGETTSGIRIGLILVNAVTTILVFLLAKYLYGSVAGAVAGITYSFLSCRPGVLGLYAHATHFVVLAALVGILLLLYAIETGRTGLFFGSGVCCGLAFLMKQPGVLFFVFAGLYWLWREWKGPFPWRNAAVRGGALLAGLVLPFGLTCLILFRAGVFPSFWFWTWSYAREYGSMTTLREAWPMLQASLPWVVRPFVIWEIVAVGLAAPLWSRYARAHGGFVASFFLFSLLAVCPGLYFRPHYFILLLPAAALCTGVGLCSVQQSLRESRFSRLVVWLPVLYFAIVFAISVRGQYKTYFHLDPVSLNKKIFDRDPFLEAVGVGSYIKAHSAEQDTIGVFGSEPEICFYAGRHCASSYLYTYPLMEKQKYSEQMRRDMMQQIRDARPKFVVYADVSRSWGTPATLEENQGFLEVAWTYAHGNYDLVEQVAVGGDPGHLWGDRAYLYVFQRTAP